MSWRFWVSWSFALGLFCLLSTSAYADFTIDKYRLSRTSVNGANATLVIYFKVCFKTGTKGIKVTPYYGDDAGTTNRVELPNRSFTTNQTCIDSGVSVTLGKYVLKGTRYIHAKFEQTGGQTLWQKAPLSITGTPEIGYVRVPVISKLVVETGDTVTIEFLLRNTGVTRSDVLSEVKILYTHIANDVLDTSKTKQFPTSVAIPKINALSQYPAGITSKRLTLTFKVPAPLKSSATTFYPRLYIAVMIDPGKKLDDASRLNNYKTFTLNYLVPDLHLKQISADPNPTDGAPSFGAKNGDFILRYDLYNAASVASKGGTITCTMTWSQFGRPGTFTTTQSQKFGSIAGKTSFKDGVLKGITITIPEKYSPSTVPISCTVKDDIGPEITLSNNTATSSILVTGWYDYSVEKLVATPQSVVSGLDFSLTLTHKHVGVTSPLLALSLSFTVTYTLNGVKYPIKHTHLPRLAFNSERTDKLKFSTKGLPVGTGTLTVEIPFSFARKDIRLRNNKMSIPFTVVKQQYDYFVERISVNPSAEQVGKKVKLTYTLGRKGNFAAATSINVRIEFLLGTKTFLIKNTNPSLLPITMSRTVTEEVTLPTTLAAGKGFIRVSIPKTFLPNETSHSNNTASTFFDVITDNDKDGFTSDKDCNDNDKAINPQAKEICDGKDNDCDGIVDEGCPCKHLAKRECYTASKGCVPDPVKPGKLFCLSPCKTGIQTCTNGQWGNCVGEVVPTKEVCDGKDNDCSGIADDNIPSVKCYTGSSLTRNKGTCRDGLVFCRNGKLTACENQVTPKTDICDGLDNDCDGQTDEDFQNKGQACSVGVGECKRSGKFVCSQDKSKLECSVKAAPPAVETCNGKDDDCNGKIDDNIVAKDCYTGPPGTRKIGECKDGKEKCVAGKIQCQGEVKPKAEVCNNKDDNCNARIDDNVAPKDCYTGPAGTKDIGPCSSGTQTCSKGKFGTCKGQTLPKIETCNGVDDNCNGRVDETLARACYTGPAGTRGVGTCKAGVQQCVGGRFSGPCVGEVKPAAETCDGKDNDCNGKVDDDSSCKEPTKEPVKEPSREPDTTTEPDTTAEPDTTKEPASEPDTEPVVEEKVSREEVVAEKDGSVTQSPEKTKESGSKKPTKPETKVPETPGGFGCSSLVEPDFRAFFVLLLLCVGMRRRRR